MSYTQADRAWAEWIAWVLEEDGHRVLVQAWDFVPGSNWTLGMQDGVRWATHTIAVFSDDYLGSVFGQAEWLAAWRDDPQGAKRKLLPVRVGECERPGLVADVVGIDVFGVDEAKAKARIRRMASQAPTGERGKPVTAPKFPPAMRAVPREARFPGAMPRLWNVPARNPNFVGRREALAALRDALAARPTVTVHSVHGMGGVGKTQLVNEFAYLRATDYDLVWWVSAEQPAAIPDQFSRLATVLGVDPEGDPETVRAAVHGALREVPGWLLVFDNADTVEDVRVWLPAVPLPAGIPGHVVVTTRRAGFEELGRVLDLDVVTPEEAVQLMRTRAPRLPEPEAGQIAAKLGRLPLALELAAAY